MTTRPLLEICAADIESVWAASRGGADRVELCSALSEGGLTPSFAMIEEALKVPGIKVNVLIRPRAGDFIYSDIEARCMERDIEICRSMGVNGVVFGALTPDGDIDTSLCRRLINVSGGLCRTFHRAFDLCSDPIEAAITIDSLGFDRILTSGQAPTALEGAPLIKDLQSVAHRVIFIAAGGITPSNVKEIIAHSGVSEIHASAKTRVQSSMKFRLQGVAMGTPGADEYSRITSSESIIRDLTYRICIE